MEGSQSQFALRPEALHKIIADEKSGRRMKSVQTVSEAGHLTTQDNPRGVALAIRDVLMEDYGSHVEATTCKL